MSPDISCAEGFMWPGMTEEGKLIGELSLRSRPWQGSRKTDWGGEHDGGRYHHERVA